MGQFNAFVRQSGVANLGVIDVVIEVPASFEIVLDLHAEAEGAWHIDIYEGTVVGAGGMAMTPRNFDRASVLTMNSNLLLGPAIAGGNEGDLLGGANIEIFRIERLHRVHPWTLKAGENYLVRLTNRTGGASDAALSLEMNEMPERGV